MKGIKTLKEGYYLIGEVSKITGISKDTLHFYDKSGLLTPDFVDSTNQYRYYSRWNLWQLDIITMCRKLSIPLEKVRKILEYHDNAKITQVLLDYCNEALRLSRYYRQVAEDILWYEQESNRIDSGAGFDDIKLQYLEQETVITGELKKDGVSYHARLQAAAKDELRYAESIQRKYGYILDMEQVQNGVFYKAGEYLKIAGSRYSHVKPEHLYTLPSGEYAVCIVHVVNDTLDFCALNRWLDKNQYDTDAVFAEELGLQLFDYIHDYYCELKAHLVHREINNRPQNSK